MGYSDYYKGPLRDYHRDPFPHSLLSTRQTSATRCSACWAPSTVAHFTICTHCVLAMSAQHQYLMADHGDIGLVVPDPFAGKIPVCQSAECSNLLSTQP